MDPSVLSVAVIVSRLGGGGSGRFHGLHDRGGRLGAGDALPPRDVRLHESPSQLREEHPALVPLARHPVGVDLAPYHKGVVGRDVEDVVEDDQGPARGLPPAAVGSDHLVQVVHASFVAVVVQDDDRFAVRALFDDLGLRVPRAQEQHVPVFLPRDVRHQSGGGREGEHGGEHRSSLDREQPGRELWLVLPNRADYGEVPVQELSRELVGGEVIVARDVAPAQSLREVEHDPQPQVPLRAPAARLSGVDLHLPSVAGSGVARHPRLDPVFRRLAGHVLSERTPAWREKRRDMNTDNIFREGEGEEEEEEEEQEQEQEEQEEQEQEQDEQEQEQEQERERCHVT